MLTNAIGSYVATAVTTIINDVTTQNGSLGWLPNNLNQVRSLGLLCTRSVHYGNVMGKCPKGSIYQGFWPISMGKKSFALVYLPTGKRKSRKSVG